MGRWLFCRHPNPALPRDHSQENSAVGRRPRPHPGLRGRRAEGGADWSSSAQPGPEPSGARRRRRRPAAGGECAARDPGRASGGPLGRAGARGGAGFCRDACKGAGDSDGEAAARGEGRRAGDWKDGCRLRRVDPRMGRPGLNPPGEARTAPNCCWAERGPEMSRSREVAERVGRA